jgi:predicted metal-binding membrane protein
MSTPEDATAPGRGGPRALAIVRRHPQVWPALGVAAAWLALLLLARQGPGAGMAGGMDMAGRAAAAGAGYRAGPGVWRQAAAGLPSWLLMTVAMMGPAALPRIGHVGRASARRLPAMTGFAAVYLAVWAAFGLGVQAAAAAIPGVPGPRALAVTLAAAVAWQLSPFKRALLRACHRAPEIRAAPRHGLRYGLCCLGACWCLMLVMVAAPGGQMYWLAGLAVLITVERAADDARGVTRNGAAALGVAAVATLAVGGLL